MVKPAIRQFGDVLAPEISFSLPNRNFSGRWSERARRPDSIPIVPTRPTPSSNSAPVLLIHGTDDSLVALLEQRRLE